MANTYSQIHLQLIFAVKNRQSLIRKEYKEDVEKYITGIVKNHNCKLLAIYCNPDHTHILIGLRPNVLISDLDSEMTPLRGEKRGALLFRGLKHHGYQ
ncbi:hypothetical protein AGMMS49574_28330 [Bacteroidia bacterium]|nr:hypothetical protein AGMMS49574_28330 [Bacteroidia bacterium]GHU57203.1 hypothetical protein FACS189411_10090 [Bacteroidia bacterium]